MNNYIVVFGKIISLYSVMGFIGLMAALFLCLKRRERYGLERHHLVDLFGYSVLGIILGSKLLALICMIPQFVQYWDEITWNMDFIETLIQSGFVFYGGLMGVICAFYIYSRQYGIDFGAAMELVAPAVPLFHFFGRIGCFTAGCCGGIDGFPLQLVEAGLNFVICAVILFIQNKKPDCRYTFCIYLLTYAVMRFILEFFRGDPERGFMAFFSVSQWISLILAAVAVKFLFSRKTC